MNALFLINRLIKKLIVSAFHKSDCSEFIMNHQRHLQVDM